MADESAGGIPPRQPLPPPTRPLPCAGLVERSSRKSWNSRSRLTQDYFVVRILGVRIGRPHVFLRGVFQSQDGLSIFYAALPGSRHTAILQTGILTN